MKKMDKIVKSNKQSGGRVASGVIARYAKCGNGWIAFLGAAVGIWAGVRVASHLVWAHAPSGLSVEVETDDSGSRISRLETEFSLNGDCGAERSPRPTVLVILARFAV